MESLLWVVQSCVIARRLIASLVRVQKLDTAIPQATMICEREKKLTIPTKVNHRSVSVFSAIFTILDCMDG